MPWGYVTSVAIIALGQFLLGNTFGAVVMVGSAAVLSNPVAITCAAVGAIYYGWNALSDAERNAIVEKLSEGLAIGVELVKAIANHVITKTRELLSAENLAEFRKFIRDAAESFGRTLGDVTRSLKERVVDVGATVQDGISGAFKRASGRFRRHLHSKTA
jgi:hypothetical protein